jgi:hypothetical protein
MGFFASYDIGDIFAKTGGVLPCAKNSGDRAK